MNGNGSPPQAPTMNIVLDPNMIQAITECAIALRSTPSEIINIWLIFGKRQFDSMVQMVPFQQKFLENIGTLERIEAAGPRRIEEKEDDEVDTATAEQRLQELRDLAKGQKEPS